MSSLKVYGFRVLGDEGSGFRERAWGQGSGIPVLRLDYYDWLQCLGMWESYSIAVRIVQAQITSQT